jgi:hypothetical protein
MKVRGKKREDGSVELTVELTKEEADGLEVEPAPTGIFSSKSEYCVTCTRASGPIRPPRTIEAYGDAIRLQRTDGATAEC